MFTQSEIALLDAVKAAVRRLEPGAEIRLFGSRARGDARPDSDWDFLILLEGEVNYERWKTIVDRLFEIELDKGTIFNLIIKGRQHWTESPATPFRVNVEEEAATL